MPRNEKQPEPPPLPASPPPAGRRWRLGRFAAWLSPWLVSLLVHFGVLFCLGLVTYSVVSGRSPLRLIASTADSETDPRESTEPTAWPVEPDRRRGVAQFDAGTEMTPVEVPFDAPRPAVPAATDRPQPATPGPTATADQPQKTPAGSPIGGGLEGRSPDARPGLAGRGGGSRQSEEAVERGLRWLVAHQRDDGSWCFDLKKVPTCQGQCRNSGVEPSTTAATALALLPFLGAGYTHQEGEHKETVKRGLYYLGTRALVTPRGGVDLRDDPSAPGAMYGQAMATIALCEAYAMTHDEGLKSLAQQAIRFIVNAQHMEGGGWRYTPGAPGDVTVTGWQLMALKSGQLARLDVPSPTLGLVAKFLDSVQTEGGAQYNYMVAAAPRQTQATTAVGLLCRMYTGWGRENPALYRGVAYLDKWGPSDNNLYFNYYATQGMRHWGGPEWQAWNGRMRDRLIAAQSAAGHESGSWHFADPYGNAGGRLYNTALAVLTLEVYYRYLPLYGQEAVGRPF